MPRRRFTDEQEKEIAKIYLSGRSTKGIARDLCIPGKDSILGALRRQGIEQRCPSDRNRLYALDENSFDVINPEVAYWWGFLYADGSISRRSLVLSLKWSDIDHLEKFKMFMKSETPIKKYIRHANEKAYPSCEIGVTSQHLVDRIRMLGIVPHRTNFSAVKDNLPEGMIRYWLMGFFDGDGTIHRSAERGTGVGFMGSLELVEWIRAILPFADNNKHIYKHTISDVYYLKFHGNIISKTFVDYLYEGQNTYMDRKHKLATSIPPPYIHPRDEFGRYCA